MTVSVLIHNLNRASALDRCLSSVAAQIYRPLEVVILDAGSRDSSLSVIKHASEKMRRAGIEATLVHCPQIGVAASRNLAARHASGDLLCFIDNDAAFATSDGLGYMVQEFNQNARLSVVAFKVFDADMDSVDPVTWVFRRSRDFWGDRKFASFIFNGTGFCIRSKAFEEAGGFWEHLQYGREEEDLTFGLLDNEWELLYLPAVSIRHYPEAKGRMSLAERRFNELRNGLLVLWRRLPVPVALFAIPGRVCTMALTARREKISVRVLIGAFPEAAEEWKGCYLSRSPVAFTTVLRYVALHFPAISERRHTLLKRKSLNNRILGSSEVDAR